MIKRYKDLKKDEKCIYQAFTKTIGVNDQPSQMGSYVNGKNIDADDEEAVIELAKRYQYDVVEGVRGADVDSGFYRFDNNAEIIAVITRSTTAKALFDTYINKFDPSGLLTNTRCKSEVWHAVYGRTDNNHNATWLDDQRIFPSGPSGSAISVCFIKR